MTTKYNYKNTKYDIRCCYCGRFCKPYDTGTYYGSTLDMEPPDPEYFCKACVKRIMKHPENVIVGCWWIKPRHVSKAESMRK
jgi:hypothetical protein